MSRRPRVLLVTPDFPPDHGGIQRLVGGLAGHLQGLDVEVVTLRASNGSALPAPDHRAIYRVRSRGRSRVTAVGRLNTAALSLALRRRPDVILSAHVVVGPAAIAGRRLLRVPFVQLVYGNEIAHRPTLTRWVTDRAEATVAISAHAERLLRATGSRGTVRIIPPGIDLPPPSIVPRAATPTIVTIARLRDHYKGHDVLLRALALVRARIPRVQWVVIGDGPLRPLLEREVRAAQLDRHVRVLGAVADADRDAYLDRAHVFALPSRLPPSGAGEGFGIVFLEAAAHGLPVVAGNVAGALEAVADQQTGLLVDPTDEHAVAEALTTLLLDREQARRLGAAGAERAREFAWPQIAIRMEGLLREAARR